MFFKFLQYEMPSYFYFQVFPYAITKLNEIPLNYTEFNVGESGSKFAKNPQTKNQNRNPYEICIGSLT
jgi:hypothetical protein